MTGHFIDPAETVQTMTGVERTHYAAMKAISADGLSACVVRSMDCSAALAFLAERKAAGKPLTFTALVVRALGRTLTKYPRFGWMARGWKLVRPSTADIGCSVGSTAAVAPVVVIRDAGAKNADAINEELARLAKEAREREKAELAKIERLARLMPIRWLFKLGVWLVVRSQRFKRRNLGTFQISVMNYTDVDFVVTSTTGVNTMIVGTIKERPVVENGRVVVRPISYLALHVNHAISGPADEKLFSEEFLRLMGRPEELV
jgi:pyruvate/2-oxoglutarate dehydrogenase complex dihydrolipoamide acyltransferase (E2) component